MECARVPSPPPHCVQRSPHRTCLTSVRLPACPQVVELTPERCTALSRDLALEPNELAIIASYTGDPAALAEVRA